MSNILFKQMSQEPQERPKLRFSSANKAMYQGQSKSTSLSSSSSGSSLTRQQTDIKYPDDILRHRRHSVKNKHKGKPGYKQFLTVEEEGEEQDKTDREGRKLLPHFTIFNDRREFLANSTSFRMMRCKSVGTLTKVDEQKKQEDDSKRPISKLNKLLDKDEFNMRRSTCNSIHLPATDNIQTYHHTTSPITEIRQAEEPKDQPTSIHEKSPIGSELQKIIVDEIDDKKKHRQEREEPVIESIMEERNDDETVDPQLRTVLIKLHEEKDFIKKMNNSDEVREEILPVDSESITLITETIKEEQQGENQN